MINRATQRGVAVALLCLALLLVWKVFFSSSHYEVSTLLTDAGQVVKGNQVRVGGTPVGTVKSVGLNNDGRAKITLDVTDGDLTPLPKGTRAIVRNSSLSAVAGRYVALEMAPNSNAKIPDGGEIPSVDSREIVDIDLVLSAVNEQGRKQLSQVVSGGADVLRGAGPGLRTTLKYLKPTMKYSRQLTDELLAADPSFDRLITDSALLAKTLNKNRSAMEQGVTNTATALAGLASQRESLRKTLAGGPKVLRSGNTAMVNTRLLLQDFTPVLQKIEKVSPDLEKVLNIVDPLSKEAQPLVSRVRKEIPGLRASLPNMRKIGREVGPALGDSAKTLDQLGPVYQSLRMYIPDIVQGLGTAFGGRAGGYYDANGHYAHVSQVLNGDGLLDSLVALGSGQPEVKNALESTIGKQGTLRTLLRDIGLGGDNTWTVATKRCPGAATQPARDGSSPWVLDKSICEPTHMPPGSAK